MLRFIKALSDEGKKNVRFIFSVSANVNAVVKLFDDSTIKGRPTTVKLWDVTDSSMEKTISFWKTQTPYTPTDDEIAEAMDIIIRLTRLVWTK